MAEVAGVVVPIIQPLINELSSGVWRELKMMCGVEKDLEKLKGMLETINNVLVDAERRSVRDEALRGWLREIKDAAFDADDVVDDFQTEALRRRCLKLNVKGKVRNFFSSNNPLLFLYKMAHEIKDVISRFDELGQLRNFQLQEGSPSSASEVVLDRETHSVVDESEVYGRDKDKENIINFLVNEDVDKNLSVLPIVGLGGLGKTTLAKLVYKDTRIQDHFEMKKWVFVGKEFKIMDIISAVVKDTSGDSSASTLEEAQRRLRAKIGGQKFLLVLDDVWNENRAKWEELEILLKGDKLGSKIIVTTRSEIVPTMMGTTEAPYKVKVLSDDNCWNLFRMRAFGPGKAEESGILVGIGKEIVKKCGGLPLAAKSLGGLMASKRGEQEWLAIRNSEIWDLTFEDESILPSLRLSYDHLSSNLKQCFAYCSVFPKNHKLERLKLIQLWIAQGFIQSSREEVPVEVIGSNYFNILLQRSFLQNEVINDFGEVISCEMHDLVHDLACLVNKGEFSTVRATVDIKPLTGRYSSVIRDDDIDKLALHVDGEAKKLRSLHILLDFYKNNISEFELGPVPLVTHLRVLDLSGMQKMTVVPKFVGKLKHLRFLDISRSRIKKLPKSVCRLYNLQTLNLRNCWWLERLPEGIENLRRLRHLDTEGCDHLTEMPSGIVRLLRGLQTLPLFIVDERCRISELQNLNNICFRGEFTIRIRRRSRMDPREAKDANLGAKPNIKSLELHWLSVDPHYPLDEEGALENLRPHPNLMRLSIRGYPRSRLPNWVGEASILPNLKKLELCDIDSCESLPSLGQLPSLEHLEVCRMKRLRRIGEEVYGDDGGVLFPALKSLTLHSLPDLEEGGILQGLSRLRDLEIGSVRASTSNSSTEWKGIQDLTALQQLRISDCAGLTKLPEGVLQLPSLQNLQLFGLRRLNCLGQRRPLFCTSLLSLSIDSCYDLIALPEWVGDLTSLRVLSLIDCPKLEQLPDGLQRLTGLQILDIRNCHLLKSRCEKVTGEDWHKIDHIPNVGIYCIST